MGTYSMTLLMLCMLSRTRASDARGSQDFRPQVGFTDHSRELDRDGLFAEMRGERAYEGIMMDANDLEFMNDERFPAVLTRLLSEHQPSLPTTIFPLGSKAAAKLATEFYTAESDNKRRVVMSFLNGPFRKMMEKSYKGAGEAIKNRYQVMHNSAGECLIRDMVSLVRHELDEASPPPTECLKLYLQSDEWTRFDDGNSARQSRMKKVLQQRQGGQPSQPAASSKADAGNNDDRSIEQLMEFIEDDKSDNNKPNKPKPRKHRR